MSIPTSFTAGDSVSWTHSEGDYLPEDSWVLSYHFVAIGFQYTLATTDNGDSTHAAALSATDSASFPSGVVTYQASVVKGAERHTVATGAIDVAADFATFDGGYDSRTDAQKYLDGLLNARAVMALKGTPVTVSSYSLEGQATTYRTLDEIDSAISRARGEVAREDKSAGKYKRVRMRFV